MRVPVSAKETLDVLMAKTGMRRFELMQRACDLLCDDRAILELIHARKALASAHDKLKKEKPSDVAVRKRPD